MVFVPIGHQHQSHYVHGIHIVSLAYARPPLSAATGYSAGPVAFRPEYLLRELARCREMMLLIPAKDAATHSAINVVINANWNLERTLRYLLQLQRQWQF